MGQTRYIPAALLAAALATALALPCAALAQARTHAQDAATRRQSERTDQANRAAAVADEASMAQGHPGANGASPAANDRSGTGHAAAPELSYGPVLTPRGQQGADPARKDPAEVRDEADTLARQAQQPRDRQLTNAQRDAQRTAPRDQQADKPADKPADKQADKQSDEKRRRAARRRQAWQPDGPMAPRPLRAGETPVAAAGVPIPPPLPAPQPTVPSSSAVRACQGIACTDAAGNTFNGSGNAGVGGDGRMCTRTGATVQCF